MPITITIPEVAVTSPTAPPAPQNISIVAAEGASVAIADLEAITNDSNVAQTLKVTVSNVVNATVTRVGITNNGNFQSQNNVTEFQTTVQPNKIANAKINFGVTPGAPGDPASEATADYLYEWV